MIKNILKRCAFVLAIFLSCVTSVDAGTYETFSTDFSDATQNSTFTITKGSITASGGSGLAWASGFGSYFLTSGSSGAVTIPNVALNNGGTLEIWWGSASSRPLIISAVSTGDIANRATLGSAERSSVLDEIYTIPSAINGSTNITIGSSGGGSVYIFKVVIYTNTLGPIVDNFGLTGVLSNAVSIDASAATINLTVPYATDLTKDYVPNFTLGAGTSFVTASDETTARNFSTSQVYALTDGSATKNYTVTVTRSAAATENLLKTYSVSINGETREGVIDQTNKTVTLTLPYSYKSGNVNASAKSAIVSNFTYSDLATCDKTSGAALDYSFSDAIDNFITVTSQAGVANSYKMIVKYDEAETNKDITNFSVGTGQVVISGTNITVTVSGTTDVTNLTPTISVSSMATVSPASGVTQDFTNPVTYTVTAEDGSIQQYTVTVVKDNTDPTITSIEPEDAKTGVSLGGTIVVTFSEKVILGTGNITLSDGTNKLTLTPNTISSDGTTVVKIPFSGLSSLTKYTLIIPAGAFTDLYGNQVKLFTSSFTTADGTLHSLPYISHMDADNFEQPAFITGGKYDAAADTRAATTTQLGAYALAAGESLTIKADSAGTVDVIFYSLGLGNYSISSDQTASTTTGTFEHYTNAGVETSLTIDSKMATTITITNTGTEALYVPYISISAVGGSAITEKSAWCK